MQHQTHLVVWLVLLVRNPIIVQVDLKIILVIVLIHLALETQTAVTEKFVLSNMEKPEGHVWEFPAQQERGSTPIVIGTVTALVQPDVTEPIKFVYKGDNRL